VRFPSPAPFLLVMVLFTPGSHADVIDDAVRVEIERQKIPGIALAVIHDGTPAMTSGFAAARDRTPRARHFRELAASRLTGRNSFHYFAENDVASRGIERFGAGIATIVYFGLVGVEASDLITAYLHSEGKMAAITFNGC
ncbi:MAG: hypothetical protein ACRES3_03170, partial [Steroidobacteraceae bacterium]